MLVGGHMAMWTILAVGFFNSIVFPTIFQLGGSRTGTTDANWIRHSEYGHCVGGAILLVVQGAIADRVGLHAFFLPVICYLFILFYGLSGSKPNSARYARV